MGKGNIFSVECQSISNICLRSLIPIHSFIDSKFFVCNQWITPCNKALTELIFSLLRSVSRKIV